MQTSRYIQLSAYQYSSMDDFSSKVAAMIQSDEFVVQTAFTAQCFDRQKYGGNMIVAVASPAGAWTVCLDLRGEQLPAIVVPRLHFARNTRSFGQEKGRRKVGQGWAKRRR